MSLHREELVTAHPQKGTKDRTYHWLADHQGTPFVAEWHDRRPHGQIGSWWRFSDGMDRSPDNPRLIYVGPVAVVAKAVVAAAVKKSGRLK